MFCFEICYVCTTCIDAIIIINLYAIINETKKILMYIIVPVININ